MLRKRPIALVEVLITLTLLTLLLSTLFGWYRHLTKQKGELEKIKRPYLEERFVRQRLEQILPKAQLPFLGEKSAIVFRFDRGITDDPKLSGTVLGRLYHDPARKTLCLGVWPNPVNREAILSPSLTLTLLDQVDQPEFRYYSPPDPFKKPVDPEQVGKPRPKEGWQSEWRYDKLPAFVHMVFSHDGKEREFYFDLNQPIIYPLVNG
ncbi:MAG: DUF1494 domain-containing protein [Chlamydiales bacterium]|nr:DUF1494 domain-containing protein [Chlamydiales bacterium]